MASIAIWEKLKEIASGQDALLSSYNRLTATISDKLTTLTQKVDTLLTKTDDLNGLVTDLQGEVTAQTNVVQSVVTLMTTQHEELLAALDNPNPTQAIADARTVLTAFASNRQALADAVAANAGPTTPPNPPTGGTTPPDTGTGTGGTEQPPPDVLTPTADNPSGVQPA